MLPCVQSLEARWDSSNTQHGHLGGWIQVSTAPQPLLPQEEPWASFKSPLRVWKVGGGVPTSSISGSCCFPTLQPYLHSTAPQLWNSELPRLALTSPKWSIIHCSARPTGGTPSTGTGPQCHTLCILHIQPFPLNSAKSTMKKAKASFFSVCFYQIPSFLPTPNLLAGTKSLNPWNVIPTSRFTGTDPSVTSQSSFFSLSLPCGATLWCMHACCV